MSYDFSKHDKLHYKNVEEGFGIILVDKAYSSVLLIQNHRNIWSFPKGHREDGESDQETAIREIKEEVGVTVEAGEFLLDVTGKSEKPVTFKLEFPWGYHKDRFERMIKNTLKKQEKGLRARPGVKKPGKVKRRIIYYIVPVEMDRFSKTRIQREEVKDADWFKFDEAFTKLADNQSHYIYPLVDAYKFLKKIKRISSDVTMPDLDSALRSKITTRDKFLLKENMSPLPKEGANTVETEDGGSRGLPANVTGGASPGGSRGFPYDCHNKKILAIVLVAIVLLLAFGIIILYLTQLGVHGVSPQTSQPSNPGTEALASTSGY